MDSTPKPANLRFLFGNHHLRAPVFEIVDGQFDDPFGIFHGVMFVKFDMNDIFLFHFGDGMGGDQFGVEASGHIGDILHDALNVHDHRVAGAGDNGQFLLQKSAAQRHAMALQYLIGRTTDPGKLDAFGAL